MLETKRQKQYFFTTVVLILILAIVTACSRGGFKFTDNTDKQNPQSNDQQVADAEAYLNVIRQTKVDPAASQALFEQILTQDDVQKEVEQELQTDQQITPPVIDEKEIIKTANSGKQAVTDYLTNTVGPIIAFNQSTDAYVQQLFYGDSMAVDSVASAQDDLMQQIKKVAVPAEAIPMHKSYLTVMAEYSDLINVAKTYASDPNSDVWPQVYHDYSIINDAAAAYQNELTRLDQKYQLAALTVSDQFARTESANPFIPTAHAFLGLGDFTVTVGDIPRLIMDSVQTGLEAAFAQFMTAMMSKLINKIEQNYMISNFLYYTDALVSGQYSQDYLNKYVADELDRNIILNLIPQFSCGNVNNQQLASVFQAKSVSYLGFDPTQVSPTDPDYTTKMVRVGSFLAQPAGWQEHYLEIAQAAESSADKAAQNELLSGGLKTPRSIPDAAQAAQAVKSSIAKSVGSLRDIEHAAIQSFITIGVGTAKNFISKFVSQLTQTFFTNFVFAGVSGQSNGGLGVLREQSTCVSGGQLAFIIPVQSPDSTQYQNPPPAPEANDIINDLCNQYGGAACRSAAPGTTGSGEEQPIELFTDPGR